MPITFCGNKLDQSILERSGLVFDINDAERVESFKESLSINYSIPTDSISLCQFADGSNEAARIRNGDSYTVLWTKNKPDGEISGVDFSIEDAKSKFTVEVSSDNILIGEQIIVTVRLFNADGVTPKTNVNTVFRLPVMTPSGSAHIKMQFVNGVAIKTVTANLAGVYVVGIKHKNGFSIKGSTPTVEVDL